MRHTFYRSPDFEQSGGTETADTNAAGNTPSVQPTENTWVSSDGGTTYIADPVQGVPYDFCVTVGNSTEQDSGAYYVRFQLSGDQDPALDIDSEIVENLAPGETTLVVVHYGAFENKFGVYHVQATVYNADTNEPISTDNGFDFTINTE